MPGPHEIAGHVGTAGGGGVHGGGGVEGGVDGGGGEGGGGEGGTGGGAGGEGADGGADGGMPYTAAQLMPAPCAVDSIETVPSPSQNGRTQSHLYEPAVLVHVAATSLYMGWTVASHCALPSAHSSISAHAYCMHVETASYVGTGCITRGRLKLK